MSFLQISLRDYAAFANDVRQLLQALLRQLFERLRPQDLPHLLLFCIFLEYLASSIPASAY